MTEPNADRAPQADRLDRALRRTRAYIQAGVDCVHPITNLGAGRRPKAGLSEGQHDVTRQ